MSLGSLQVKPQSKLSETYRRCGSSVVESHNPLSPTKMATILFSILSVITAASPYFLPVSVSPLATYTAGLQFLPPSVLRRATMLIVLGRSVRTSPRLSHNATNDPSGAVVKAGIL